MEFSVILEDKILVDAITSAMEAGRTYGTAGWAKLDFSNFESYLDLLKGEGFIQLQEINADETKFDGPIYKLDKDAIERGVSLMWKHKNKKLFSELYLGDIDGPLGDVLVQLAVLGEIRYG